MLQIELRINGVLVEFVDITNEGRTLPGTQGQYVHYSVSHGRQTRTVFHKPSDGALVLSRLALEALTTRRNLKPKGKEDENAPD